MGPVVPAPNQLQRKPLHQLPAAAPCRPFRHHRQSSHVYKARHGLPSSAQPSIDRPSSETHSTVRHTAAAFSFPDRSCCDGFSCRWRVPGLGGAAPRRELRVHGVRGQVHRRRHLRLDHRGGLHHLGQRQETQSRRFSRVQLRRRGAQRGGGERGGLRVLLRGQRAHQRRQRHQHRRAQDRGEALLHLRRRRPLQQRHEARRHRSRGRHRRVAAAQGIPDPGDARHHAGHDPDVPVDQLRGRHAQDPGHRARAPDQAVRVGRHRAQGHGAGFSGRCRGCGRGTLLGPMPGWRQCCTLVGCLSWRSFAEDRSEVSFERGN